MLDRPPARLALILLLFAAPLCVAQQPAAQEEQETVKVYTEEVRLPVVAYDDRERFDPTLAADDVLVLEDGVPQHVRSVRRVPANVLLVFDMGGQVTSTGAANATREAALRFVARLGDGNRVALIQTTARRPELLLDWTTDASVVTQALKTKLFSAPRSRLSECLAAAAEKLKERPVGNTHVVIFTDGLEGQSRDEIRADDIAKGAVRSLLAAQASVHVFCFASLVEQAVKYHNNPVSFGGTGRTVSVILDTDFEMRRWFKNYALATKRREAQLAELAREAGGRVLLPSSPEEVPALAEKVARDIGAQYVVTYKPLRPFAEGGVGERRRAEVSARRMGLQLFTLRSVVTAPQRTTPDEK
ncbi:MAG: VWA domain-containing protein [Pyrinomonadaceae bacterium]